MHIYDDDDDETYDKYKRTKWTKKNSMLYIRFGEVILQIIKKKCERKKGKKHIFMLINIDVLINYTK